MDGRAFLHSAQRLLAGGNEADWRTSAGRSYYALLNEVRTALRRWGFVPPRRDQIHAWVGLRLIFSKDADLYQIGRTLENLNQLRNQADYQLEVPGLFVDLRQASLAIGSSRAAIALLDQIEADPARRAAALTAIQTTIVP
jgi:hypothetical protein